MPNLVLLITVSFCSGISAGKFLSFWIFFLFLIFLLLFFLLIIFMIKIPHYRTEAILSITLCVIFFLFGFLYFKASTLAKPEVIPYSAYRKQVVCFGKVISDPIVNGQQLSFYFKTEKIKFENKTIKKPAEILVNINAEKGKVPNKNIEYGDMVKLSGKLYPPREKNLDAPLRFYAKKITLLEKGQGNFLLSFSYKLKKRLMQIHKNTLPEPYASLMSSFIFGRGAADIPSKIEESYLRSGLIHLLVVSGTQVSLLLGFLFNFFSIFCFRPFLNFTLTSIFNVFYLTIIGFQPSILRASMMFELALLAKLFDRDNYSLNSLAFSALIILIFKPLFLFDIGFQLSFAATFALIYAVPIVVSKLKFLPSVIAHILAVGALPTIFTYPIVAFYFNEISLVSIFTNILILPWAGILVITGFSATILGLFFPFLGYLVNQTNLLILFCLQKIIDFFNQFPFAVYFVSSPSFIFFIFYYGLIFLILSKTENKMKLKITKTNILLTLFILFLFFIGQIFAADFNSLKNEKLTVNFLDVGQGDSILIESPTGKKVLLDSGAYEIDDETQFDAGEKIVLPYLKKKGINQLDLVVVSHPHSDHVGGLISVLEKIKTVQVADIGYPHPTPTYHKFLNLIKEKKIPYKKIKEGYKIDFGKDVFGYLLHPPSLFLENTGADVNNNSAVIYLIYNKVSFLFTGDIEKEAEKVILKKYSNFFKGVNPIRKSNGANILKVAHHGSRTSTSKSFLSAVKPRMAIISVGRNNPFHHPHPSVIKRLQEQNIKIFRSDLNGDIIVETDGEKYSISVERGADSVKKNTSG